MEKLGDSKEERKDEKDILETRMKEIVKENFKAS